MALTTEQTVRRDRLQVAYDKLICGQNATVTQSNGRRVEYGPGDAERLKVELDQLNALAAGRGRTRGALTFRL